MVVSDLIDLLDHIDHIHVTLEVGYVVYGVLARKTRPVSHPICNKKVFCYYIRKKKETIYKMQNIPCYIRYFRPYKAGDIVP